MALDHARVDVEAAYMRAMVVKLQIMIYDRVIGMVELQQAL